MSCMLSRNCEVYHVSLEAREKISKALKGRIFSEESRRKMSQSRMGEKNHMYGRFGAKHHMFGKHLSLETKEKISNSLKGRKASKELKDKLSKLNKGTRNPMYGRKGINNPLHGKSFSLDHRMKISKAHKGKVLSEKTRKKISISKTGEKSPMWKGGRFKQQKGYILVISPNHPFKNCMGYVREHRLMLERYLRENKPNHFALMDINGIKYIGKEYVIHHINGIKDDNRIENLQICKTGEHSKLHQKAMKKQIEKWYYRYVLCRNHPLCTKSGLIAEHRLIMEDWLLKNNPNHDGLVEINGKKYLGKNWVVHHKDGIKINNVVENLEVMTKEDHMRLHINFMYGSGD